MQLKLDFLNEINSYGLDDIISLINDITINFWIQKSELRQKIRPYLEKNGFEIENNKLNYKMGKENIRNLHKIAVLAMREKYRKKLEPIEQNLIQYFADGKEIKPKKIQPKMLLVDSSHKLWNLFNYVKIHWNIPISNGYGKRLNYLIFDKNNDKVIGILGLCDPVFSIKSRDDYIGWGKEDKKKNLSKIMEGYIIGSVPPYNKILGGKFVSSLLFSNNIREDYKKKYKGTKSFIKKRVNTGELVLISTLSALGKSSIYDRIKIPNGQSFISCGYSNGYGEFQFHGSLYEEIFSFVSKYFSPTRKVKGWGSGFRNKREVIQKFISSIDIPYSFLRHNIRREQFIIPLCKNYKQVLILSEKPKYFDISIEHLSEFMKNRWLIPRSQRDDSFLKWKKENYYIWN